MFIQLGEIKIKLLIPILFPFFLKLRRLSRRKNNIDSAALKGFNDFLGMTSCGIFYLIIKLNTKSIKKQKRDTPINPAEPDASLSSEKSSNSKKVRQFNSMAQIQKDDMDAKKKQYRKQLYFILFISLLQLIAILIKNYFKKSINAAFTLNVSTLYETLLLVFFSVKFLGLIIYSHQKFSMISLSLCLLIFFIESIIYKHISIKEIIYALIYYFVVQFFYCLSDIFGKKYLNTFPDNIYAFLFKLGIFGLIPLSIYGLIVSFLDINPSMKIFQNLKNISIPIYLFDIFFSVLFEVGLWLTIYYFTPCHYIIFECIADFLEIILSEFDQKADFTKGQKISFFIIYPIIIFIVFVFNEIIILNFCGLSHNTKIKIIEREKLDFYINEMTEHQLMSDQFEIDNEYVINS